MNPTIYEISSVTTQDKIITSDIWVPVLPQSDVLRTKGLEEI